MLPMLMAVGVALTIINTRAVLEALFGVETSFVRTPKYAIGDRQMNLETKQCRDGSVGEGRGFGIVGDHKDGLPGALVQVPQNLEHGARSWPCPDCRGPAPPAELRGD